MLEDKRPRQDQWIFAEYRRNKRNAATRRSHEDKVQQSKITLFACCAFVGIVGILEKVKGADEATLIIIGICLACFIAAILVLELFVAVLSRSLLKNVQAFMMLVLLVGLSVGIAYALYYWTPLV